MTTLDGRIPCPVLVGRGAELRALAELLESAARGSGETVLLGGDAGVGKTRLCRELKREATSRGLRVVEGRCSSAEASVPYAPFLDALRFRLARGEGVVAARVLGPLAGRLAPLLPDLPPEAELAASGPAPGDRPLEAIHQAFRRLTGLGPLLLVLEDIHWADPTSCDLLHFLSRRIAGDPLLILATYRGDELHGGHPVRRLVATLARERVAREMVLKPLTADEVREMVRAIFEVEPQPDFVAAVWERTEGNPLFVEELLKSLLDAANIGPRGQSAADFRNAELPATIRETILARVESLGPQAVEILSIASIIGRRTSFDLLTAVTGGAEEDLLPVVERLVAHQLLAEEGGPGDEQCAFRHILTQEVLYHSMIARRRRFWHRRVATALEARPAEELPRHYDALAYHCRLGGDGLRARKYEVLAGDQAVRLCAWPDAEAHYERALEALEGPARDPELEAELLEKVAEVAWWQSRVEDALRYAEEALALRRSLGDRETTAALLRRIGLLYAHQRHEWDRALGCYREAITLLEDAPGSLEAARAANDLGRLCLARGDLGEAARRLAEGLAFARRLGDKEEEAIALAGLGELAVRRGNVGRGIEQLEAARAIVQAGAVGLERASAVYRAGMRALETAREHARALEWIEGAIAHAEHHGVAGDVAIAQAYRAAVGRRLGRWDRALGDALRAVDELRATRRAELGEALRILGDLHRVSGAFEPARRAYEEALTLGEADAEIGLALGALAEGRADQAAAAMVSALGSRHPDDRLFALRVLPFLVEAQVRASQVPEAHATLERLTGEAARSDYRARQAAVTYATGLVHGTPAAFEAAAEAWHQLDQPLERFQAVIAFAAFLVQDEAQRARGTALARAALAECERLGAAVEAKRARQVLRQAGVRAPRPGPRPSADHGLTARELEVLAQLVKGHTNREIARTLGIAEKTAGIHVSHILAKLGCATRTQAVWQAIAKQLLPVA